MKGKRQRRRLDAGCPMNVTDALSHETLGTVVNISGSGFMVRGAAPVDINTERVYALEIHLPDGVIDKTMIAVSAGAVWLRRDPDSGLFEMGFRLAAADRMGKELWQSLLSRHAGKPARTVHGEEHQSSEAEPAVPTLTAAEPNCIVVHAGEQEYHLPIRHGALERAREFGCECVYEANHEEIAAAVAWVRNTGNLDPKLISIVDLAFAGQCHEG